MKLASRGQRDLDAGPEVIVDAAEVARVRRQAREVYIEPAQWVGAIARIRPTDLVEQLSKLAENEGEVALAVKYQQQLSSV